MIDFGLGKFAALRPAFGVTNSTRRFKRRRGVPHEEDSDSVRSVRACGRSDGADGAGSAGRNAGRLRKRCRNAFRQIHRTRARYVAQVRLEARPRRSLRRRRVQPDRYGEPHARRRAFGHTEYGAKAAPITDPEKLQEALKASYANLQKAITALSDNDLQAPVKLFGRDMTKQGALMLILEDQHEHLGQSIAYARSNGMDCPRCS